MCKNQLYKSLEKNNYNEIIPNKNKGKKIQINCGKCEYCRILKYEKWKNKLLLEAETNIKKNYIMYFITLTYDEKNINYYKNNNILYNWQKTMKLIRWHNKDLKIKYFLTTETGSKTGRIHHHLILWASKDFLKPSTPIKKIGKGGYFQSKELKWEYGYHSIAKPNQTDKEQIKATIKYVIKYILKNPIKIAASKNLGIEEIEKHKINENEYIYNKIIRNIPNKKKYLKINEIIKLQENYKKFNNKLKEQILIFGNREPIW